MYKILIYGDIVSVSGKDMTRILKELSMTDYWKSKHCDIVSLGWSYLDREEVHYVKRECYIDIAMYLFQRHYSVKISHTEALPPISRFEQWEIPANQEDAIAKGYMDGGDTHFLKHHYGAWRVFYPII